VPSEDEIADHSEQHGGFETVQSLKSWLMRVLDTNSDSGVPTDEWRKAKLAHHEAFVEWMQTAKYAVATGDQDMSEDKARKLWPFDKCRHHWDIENVRGLADKMETETEGHCDCKGDLVS
jgi:hypothetical protein